MTKEKLNDHRPDHTNHVETGQICKSAVNGKQWYRLQPQPYQYTAWCELPLPIDELVKFYFDNK